MNKKKKYKNYIAVSFFWGKVTGIFQVGFSWFVRKQKRRRKIPNYYKNGRNTITGKKDVIYFIKWVFTKNKGTYLLREEFVWWLVDCICSFSTSGFESHSFTYLAQESTSVTGIFQVCFPYLEISPKWNLLNPFHGQTVGGNEKLLKPEMLFLSVSTKNASLFFWIRPTRTQQFHFEVKNSPKKSKFVICAQTVARFKKIFFFP